MNIYVLASFGLFTGIGFSGLMNPHLPTAAANNTSSIIQSRAASHRGIYNQNSDDSSNNQSGHSSTTLIINGTAVPMPENGRVTRSINTDNGTTKIDVSVESHTSASDNVPEMSHQIRSNIEMRTTISNRATTRSVIKNSE